MKPNAPGTATRLFVPQQPDTAIDPPAPPPPKRAATRTGTGQEVSDPSLPSAPTDSEFEKLIKDSPFAPATPQATPAEAAAPSFAENYFITCIAKVGDQTYVGVSTKDKGKRFTLQTGGSETQQPSDQTDGIKLVSVDMADEVSKSKVTVQKDSEFGKLEFDQEAARNAATAPQPVPAVPGQPNIPMPQIPRQFANGNRRFPIPGNTRPNVPQFPPVVNPNPGPVPGQVIQQPNGVRSRIRLIHPPGQ